MQLLIGVLLGLLIIVIGVLNYLKEKNKFKHFGNFKQNRRMQNIKRFIRLKINESKKLSKKNRYIIIGIAILFALTANNLVAVFHYMFWGLLIGLVLVKVTTNMKTKALKTRKIKEIVTLFEAVELYTQAGYTVYQSLKTARTLTHTIRPAVERCLDNWSSSPEKALENLQKELGLQESEILILLMIHMENAGPEEMQGILKREALNINRKEILKKQMGMANRPLALMVFRMLPSFSILGITIGSFLYRTYAVLTQAGLF